ncbi:MAG TPA: ATP-binding protein [Candidatus Acidoferrum sp.]|nr:ATP-binding protein [Candidatus Acidoferrum sp.]
MADGLIRALRRRIAVKLTLTLLGFVAVTVLVTGLYLNHALERLAVESLESRLATAAALLHDDTRARLAAEAPPELHNFAVRAARSTGSRVTLITTDGRVVADSEVPVADLGRLENHASRPEVAAALAGRTGHHLRRSATIDAPLFYVAVPVTESRAEIGATGRGAEAGAAVRGAVRGVLRLALPLSAVTASHAEVQHVLLLGAALALVVALGIGLFVASRVTRPVVEMEAIARRMSEGDFTARAPTRSPDEIGRLGRALNVMSASLRAQIENLEHERARISAMLDGMVEGVVAVDAHDQIVAMNEPARVLFGAVRAEGKPLLEAIRNADLHALLGEVRRADAHAVGADAHVVGADAHVVARREFRVPGVPPRTVQANAVPVDLGGGEVGVVMVLHDVSELRRLESVRTEFVANVSHELRTPLTAIHGYLETLLGGALDEPEHARRFLEIVFRHTERLGRLLDDLRELSDIELGRVHLQLGPVAVEDVVESVVAIMRPRAESRGVTLTSALPSDTPDVMADHDRLEQVLINLVDNAVKYTEAGGRVTVSARPVDAAVEIAVADTGVGIPPADLPRITERFYRVDKARSRELGGTGLGLAIVKHLVIAHGGTLTLESEPGRGTTVRVVVPITDWGVRGG